MYCPECGHDAGDAKYCPECGADLESLRNALRGKTTGKAGGAARRGGGGQGTRSQQGGGPSGPGGTTTIRGLSPAVIWGVFGAIAVAVIILVVMLSGGFGGASGSSDQTNTASATPVQGVVDGDYNDLVLKGNELYDQGDAAFQQENFAQGSEYFKAAAMTYTAAWQKKQTDPNVGTDLATALFYAGSLDAAVKQANLIIKKYPDFQPAYFNLGNYLAHKARIAEQQGDSEMADAAYAQAKKAYTKAVAIDPETDIGKQSDARLKELP
jgi:hypothetical protein